jgi:hypothetical protein
MSISTPSPQYQALGAVVTIGIYLYIWPYMYTAKLFQSGRNQAVLLPQDYRLNGSEVAVKHFGNSVPLLPIKSLADPGGLSRSI